MTRRQLLKSLALALFSLPWLPKILGAQEPERIKLPPSLNITVGAGEPGISCWGVNHLGEPFNIRITGTVGEMQAALAEHGFKMVFNEADSTARFRLMEDL